MGKTKKYKSRKYIIGRLQNLYCSCQSEFSAFLLFNYQSLISKSKELSYMFKSFSLSHLNSSQELAKIILSLKGLPFYLNSQNAPLSAFWIKPETNFKKILLSDINFLKSLIEDYTFTINSCSDNSLKAKLLLLKNLNLDELDLLCSLDAKCTNKPIKIDSIPL